MKKTINYTCEYCEKDVTLYEDFTDKESAMIENNLCESCFNSDYIYCPECEEYHQESEFKQVETYDSVINVCTECVEYHEGDKYFYCPECETYYLSSDYYQEEIYNADTGEYIYWCESCKDTDIYVYWCEYHDRYEYSQESVTIQNYGEICQEAFEYGDFCTCEGCEDRYHREDMYFTNERDDRLLCECCYDNWQEDYKGDFIKSYHDHKCEYINNNKISDNTGLTFGFELEVEEGNIISCGEMAEILHDSCDGFLVFESDGSLDNGYENISVPFDMNYYESEGKEIIKNALQLLSNNGFKSHDTSTCGYHIHVGRHGLGESYGQRCNTISKINIVCEYFKEELTTLSRRKESQLNRWAKFTTRGINKEDLTIDYIENKVNSNKDRYSAINLNNESTIEFRIFRGTLKKETFLATFELVHNICSWCKDNEITDLDNLDFISIAMYDKNEYIEDYLKSKNIIKVTA